MYVPPIWVIERAERRLGPVWALAGCLLFASPGWPASAGTRAEAPESASRSAPASVSDAALDLPVQFQRGPVVIELGAEAVLDLPADFAFLPAMETRSLLREWGNRPSDRTVGMVVPTREGAPPPWFMVISHVPEGHVDVTDTRDWDRDAMLVAIRKGLSGNNAVRREEGAAQTEVLGWARPPRFDAASHRLTWALSIRDKPPKAGASAAPVDPDDEPDEDPDAELIANDNTILLGRRGYLNASVVLPILDYVRHAGEIATLVAAIRFRSGEGYTDFDADTDRRSQRALSALLVAEPAARAGWLDRLLARRVEVAYVLGAVLIGGLIGAVSRLRMRSAARREVRPPLD